MKLTGREWRKKQQVALPNKKYSIIYADPPWQYDDPKGNLPKMGGITYNTMKSTEIAKIPISRLADKDCFLFIWVTMPTLQEVFPIIEAWGFRYITCAFTWVKISKNGGGIYSGLGNWTNGNAELCLLAKKGTPKRVAKNVKQIQMYPIGKHSAKPPTIRNEIVRLCGDLPRIELFARNKVEGWDAWGN